MKRGRYFEDDEWDDDEIERNLRGDDRDSVVSPFDESLRRRDDFLRCDGRSDFGGGSAVGVDDWSSRYGGSRRGYGPGREEEGTNELARCPRERLTESTENESEKIARIDSVPPIVESVASLLCERKRLPTMLT